MKFKKHEKGQAFTNAELWLTGSIIMIGIWIIGMILNFVK